jgi:hypothetical protein
MRTHLISMKGSASGRITKAVRCHVPIGLMCLLLQNDIHADDTIAQVGTMQIQIKNNNWQGSPLA